MFQGRLESFVPHFKQRVFQAARAFRRRWFVAGRQTGKTDIGAAEAALFATHFRPGEEGAIFVPSYPHAIVARTRFESMLPRGWAKWNGQDRMWTFVNGSRVYLRSLRDIDAPRGLSLTWAWCDEPCLYNAKAWDNLRPALAVHQAHAWFTTTPKGHDWVWQQAVKHAEPNVDYTVRARSVDSPYFPDSEWQAVLQRYGVDSAFVQQEYMGAFTAFVGAAFPGFRRELLTMDLDQAIATRFPRGWDFGWTAPTVCASAWITNDSGIHVTKLQTWTQTRRLAILRRVNLATGGPDCIDPAGTASASTTGKQGGDRSWQDDMISRGSDVRWTRRVSETGRLNFLRELIHTGRLTFAEDMPNLEEALLAFESVELDDNPEHDRLKDNQHPHADIVDAVGYIAANLLMRDDPSVERVPRNSPE